jgi:hypothetical protein
VWRVTLLAWWGELTGAVQVPFIGRVPLDPNLTTCGEAGASFFERFPSSPSLQILEGFIATLRD